MFPQVPTQGPLNEHHSVLLETHDFFPTFSLVDSGSVMERAIKTGDLFPYSRMSSFCSATKLIYSGTLNQVEKCVDVIYYHINIVESSFSMGAGTKRFFKYVLYNVFHITWAKRSLPACATSTQISLQASFGAQERNPPDQGAPEKKEMNASISATSCSKVQQLHEPWVLIHYTPLQVQDQNGAKNLWPLWVFLLHWPWSNTWFSSNVDLWAINVLSIMCLNVFFAG